MTTLPFTLSPKDLEHFGPDRAVEFMRRLLWAESARVGIPPHLVTVPSNIYAADGGIDALIREADPSDGCVIPRGETGFQIKASDLGPTACKEELHERGALSEPLKPEIKRLMDAGGNYVLVLFTSLTNAKIEKRRNDIKENLAEQGYPNAEVRLYTADNIAPMAERFPGVVAWLKPDYNEGLSYSAWARRSDVKEPSHFVSDTQRTEWIEHIRLVLQKLGSEGPVFRVTGLPGIGKTRFVFEALSPDDLQSRVIYVTADRFLHSSLFQRLQMDENLSANLVVDECNLAQHDELVRAFSKQGSRLSVITMSYDNGGTPPPTEVYELSQLEKSAIEEILRLQSRNLPQNVIRRLANFADGYPRIAILLAQSYLQYPGEADEYVTISDDDLMTRLIGGSFRPDSTRFQTTEKVLMGISLFEKIGFDVSAKLDEEARWVSDFMEVRWSDFEKIVYEQKERGLIQGRYYLYVTPFMLRVHLLKKWWEIRGFTRESFEKFVSDIPDTFRYDLLDRFTATVPFLSSVSRGEEFVKDILNRDGIYADGSLLKTPLGGKLFLALAEASPGPAVARLRETVGCWSKDELSDFKEGRKYVVWALEKIAFWREHFRDAAQILLQLAEAENATYSNNASGTFVKLFSPAPSPVAPTEASPEERFPILKGALSSESAAVRSLGLRACDAALVTWPFSRIAGAEDQGLHRLPDLWKPKTDVEFFDAYRRVWETLRKSLTELDEEEKLRVAAILLKRSSDLNRHGNLADMVVETVAELATRHGIDKLQVLEIAMQRISADGDFIPVATRRKWEQLRDSLVEPGYHSRMVRYVGAELFEESFDEEIRGADQKQEKITQLARESLENPGLLQKELDWLSTSKAADGYNFGYELSKIDVNSTFLVSLIQAQRNTREDYSLFFLGGYFAKLAERDSGKWEAEIETLANNPDTQRWICKLTFRSRLPSDASGLRILSLAETGVILPEDFGIFVYGGVIRNLSPETFHKWIEFLLGEGSVASATNALELFYMYYLMDKNAPKFPVRLAFKIITHEIWFQQSERREPGIGYHWSEIANAAIRACPQRALELADKMLASLGESGTIFYGLAFNSVPHGVLNEILTRFPMEVWQLATQYLGPPITTSAFHINQWLRGDDDFDRSSVGAFIHIPAESIWQWVDQDVENRAWYLASFVPKILFHESDRTCLARELLVRYGNLEDVLRNFSANYSTQGWSGSESQHHQETRKHLLDFKRDETDPNVIRWIDQHISWLEDDIKRAEIKEERRGF